MSSISTYIFQIDSGKLDTDTAQKILTQRIALGDSLIFDGRVDYAMTQFIGINSNSRKDNFDAWVLIAKTD